MAWEHLAEDLAEEFGEYSQADLTDPFNLQLEATRHAKACAESKERASRPQAPLQQRRLAEALDREGEFLRRRRRINRAYRRRRAARAKEETTMQSQDQRIEMVLMFGRLIERLLTLAVEPTLATTGGSRQSEASAPVVSLTTARPAAAPKQAISKRATQGPGKGDTEQGQKIVRAVCDHFKTTEQRLLGKSKNPELDRARKVAWFLLSDVAGFSKIRMATFFRVSDNTIGKVLHQAEEQLKTDHDFAQLVRTLRTSIEGKGGK